MKALKAYIRKLFWRPAIIEWTPAIAADQPKTKCDSELFEHGVRVCIIDGLASTAMEAQVVRWRTELRVPLDWHYVGGRAVLLCQETDYKMVLSHVRYFQVRVVPIPNG